MQTSKLPDPMFASFAECQTRTTRLFPENTGWMLTRPERKRKISHIRNSFMDVPIPLRRITWPINLGTAAAQFTGTAQPRTQTLPQSRTQTLWCLTRMPDEIKGSGIIQFLDDLDWSFEKQSKTTGSRKVARVRWHTAEWRTEDSKWTSCVLVI